jgi:alkylhydroperoxidase family enzyme
MSKAPRIPRITREEWNDDVQDVFDALNVLPFKVPDQTKSHVLQTLARHPALAKPFLAFNMHLLAAASLPARLRQLAIMRVGWLRKSGYIWPAHIRVSLNVGLKREDVEAIKVGPSSPHWSKLDRAVVTATDELIANSEMSDATWNTLSAELDQKQLMDLMFTVGCYTMLAMTLNTVKVEREEDLEQYAKEYGLP